MKPNRYQWAGIVLAGLASLALSGQTEAQTFTNRNEELILNFRKTGATGGTVGAYDLEIDVGPATNYYAASPGSSFMITQFTTAQISALFDSLDDMTWSVSGCVPLGGSADPSLTPNTLWVTRARPTPAVRSTAWTVMSDDAQQLTAGKIRSVFSSARTYGKQHPAALVNTLTAIGIPDGSGFEYSAYVGSAGDYGSTFEGNIELTTPSDFTQNSTPARADLYQLLPSYSATAAKYLGYFELRTDGTMAFVAAPSSSLPPAPTLSISRANSLSTVSFGTTNGATYTLHYTNSDGLTTPASAWPVAGAPVTGDGNVKSIGDPTSDLERYYRVEAH